MEDAIAGGLRDGTSLIGNMNVTMAFAMLVKTIHFVMGKTHGIPWAMELFATKIKDTPTATRSLV